MRKSIFKFYRTRLDFFKNKSEERIFKKMINQILKAQKIYELKGGFVKEGENEGDLYAIFTKNLNHEMPKIHSVNYVRLEYNSKKGKVTMISYRGPKMGYEKEKNLADQKEFKLIQARHSILRKNIKEWFLEEYFNCPPYKIIVSFHTQFEMIRYHNIFYNYGVGSTSLAPEVIKDITTKEINKRTYREICALCDAYSGPTRLANNALRCKVISLNTDLEVEGAGSFLESELSNQIYRQILKHKEMKEEKPKRTFFDQKLFNFLLYLELRRFAY